MAIQFATRMENMRASEIREILKLTEQPGVISFAGGLPATEPFPVEALQQIALEVLKDQGRQALQYTATEGFMPLRRHICGFMAKFGCAGLEPEDLIITSGSQQGIDFSGRLFLNKGDIVLVESPTYLGAISAFRAYEPRFVEIATDGQGMIIADLEEKIRRYGEQIKLIYVIPDFQNPTGNTWSLARRRALLALAKAHDLMIIEDNPYGALRYENAILPAIFSLDTDARKNVVFLGSFSKIFCPGYRLAWVLASPDILSKYVLIKQGADLQSSSISQREVSLFLDRYNLDDHIAKIVRLYRSRRDLMLNSLDGQFPVSVRYTRPEGGLFLWLTFPARIDSEALALKCLERKVAYVPGRPFYPNGGPRNQARLNFSAMPEPKIQQGIGIMAEMIKAELRP